MTGREMHEQIEKALKKMGEGDFSDADLYENLEDTFCYRTVDSIIRELKRNYKNNHTTWISLDNKDGHEGYYGEFTIIE